MLSGYQPGMRQLAVLLIPILFSLLPPFAHAAPVKEKPPRVKINAKDGAEMVFVPGGDFHPDAPYASTTLPDYYIYKNLVTVAMYEKFCRETNRPMPDPPDFNPAWWKKDHPIVNVGWKDAKAYCDWAGVGLPSYAQWLKAAQGTDNRAYPWGNKWKDELPERRSNVVATFAIGSYPETASPYGLMDATGNVWQWLNNLRASHGLDTPLNPTEADFNVALVAGRYWDFGTTRFYLFSQLRTADSYTGFRGCLPGMRVPRSP